MCDISVTNRTIPEKDNRLLLFQGFLKESGVSPNTVTVYTASVRLYFSLYDELTMNNLLSYKQYLIQHYKAATVNARIYGINQYIRQCGEGLEVPLETYRLPSVKQQQKMFLDNVISQTDYERLKKGLKQDHNMFWYFVVRFLCSSGARISELLQIKVEHVRMGYMDLCSKGGKIRRIYFPESLCTEELQWLESNGVSSGFLFTNRSGQPISPRGISLQLKALARRYGVPENTVYPHSFRHRFAKNFLNRFNDIALLADLMGHESIETTRIYLKRSSDEQRLLIDRVVTW